MNEEFITVRIPRDCWDQLVSDYENMCGVEKDEIEILQDAYVVEDLEQAMTPIVVKPESNRKGMSQYAWWNDMTEDEKFRYQYPDFEG